MHRCQPYIFFVHFSHCDDHRWRLPSEYDPTERSIFYTDNVQDQTNADMEDINASDSEGEDVIIQSKPQVVQSMSDLSITQTETVHAHNNAKTLIERLVDNPKSDMHAFAIQLRQPEETNLPSTYQVEASVLPKTADFEAGSYYCEKEDAVPSTSAHTFNQEYGISALPTMYPRDQRTDPNNISTQSVHEHLLPLETENQPSDPGNSQCMADAKLLPNSDVRQKTHQSTVRRFRNLRGNSSGSDHPGATLDSNSRQASDGTNTSICDEVESTASPHDILHENSSISAEISPDVLKSAAEDDFDHESSDLKLTLPTTTEMKSRHASNVTDFVYADHNMVDAFLADEDGYDSDSSSGEMTQATALDGDDLPGK